MNLDALRRRATVAVLAAATVFATSLPAAAQDPPPPAGDGEPELLRFVAPKDGYSILDLLEAVNKQTGRTVLFDNQMEKKIKGAKVQFVGTYEVPRDKLFGWLQGVLSFSTYVLVPIGPTDYEQWMVVDITNQAIRSRPTWVPEEDLEQWKDRDGVYIVSTLRAKNLDQQDAGRARAAIQQLVTGTASIGRINEVPGQNAFVMADFAPVVYASKRLLEAMDVPLRENELLLVRVEINHAVASDIEGMLRDLLGSTTPQGQPRPNQAGRQATKPDPQIIADTRSNSLVLYAVQEDVDKILRLVEQLDTEYRGKSHLNFRALQFQEAQYVADLLDALIGGAGSAPRTSSRSSSSRTNRAARTAPQPNQPGGAPFSGSAGENAPVIIPDERSNSLIIHATPEQFQDLESLIARIDRPRKQVLIETALIELTVGDQLDLGVEAFSVDRNVAVDTNGDGEVDTFTDERSFFGAVSQGLTNIVPGNVNGIDVPIGNSPNIVAGGLTAGIFNNGRIPLILQAVQKRSPAKIVTMPSIVTGDNHPATITTEDSIPFLITTFVGPNQTPQQTFDSVSATTKLTISPSISADDYLRLNINQEVTSFRSAAPGQRPPTTSRKLETELMVPNAATVVLGGIVSTTETESRTGIPLLMDIPLLGFLFQNASTTLNKTNLFLFVTPRILKDLETYRDFHALSWEKKLLQDKLFGEDVNILGTRFLGPDAAESATNAVKGIEESGLLDAYRYKAEPGQAEREAEARRAWERMKEIEAEEGSDVKVTTGGGAR